MIVSAATKKKTSIIFIYLKKIKQDLANQPGVIAKSASSIHLWTKFGAFKLSNILNAKNAKVYRKIVIDSLFNLEGEPQKSATLKKSATPKIVSLSEKIELLKFLIEKCEDKALRDEIIKYFFEGVKQF